MGNCACRRKRKETNEEGQDGDDPTAIETDKKDEDLTYATIEHCNTQTTRVILEAGNDDCDYAIISLPTVAAPKLPIKEDVSDDYVLME
ncbi:hypothetical protein UPYG_G00306120 [Umbra pygmaea]|uniref:Uncharacterized protein n=1 Tax=Umbra pygmaea TaxID=75934 RepID=A0ABD0VYK9_UMBPY